jgi:pyridoxamine 5'-phosphate oxidase-like protein
MATWGEFEAAVPEFAERIRKILDAHKHKTIATLRQDGSPRISGIEADVVAGDLWFGSMPRALKARDLQRDPRFALHSASFIAPDGDPSTWPGDAKLSGRAIEITDPEERRAAFADRGQSAEDFGDSHFFKADIHEVVYTGVRDNKLQIELWKPGHPLRTFERD